MRHFVAMLVAAATLATAVVSVRLHLHVAQLRYRLWSLEEESRRAERELRLAHAELEAAKAPRRLMDRWMALRDAVAATTLATAEAPTAPSPPLDPAEADLEVLGVADPTPQAPEAHDLPPEPSASEGGP